MRQLWLSSSFVLGSWLVSLFVKQSSGPISVLFPSLDALLIPSPILSRILSPTLSSSLNSIHFTRLISTQELLHRAPERLLLRLGLVAFFFRIQVTFPRKAWGCSRLGRGEWGLGFSAICLKLSAGALCLEFQVIVSVLSKAILDPGLSSSCCL